ncbi:hypothetical protein D3C75_1014990 [compost metagenome]
MRPQPLIRPQMGAFGQQPAVNILQQGTKTVRVFEKLLMVAPADFKLIAERGFTTRYESAEKTTSVIAIELNQAVTGFTLYQPHGTGIRQQRTNL